MKKIFILLFVCSFTILSIHAQNTGLTFSEKVLLKPGLSKLIILKNGKTANLVVSEEDGLVCTLFNANHQKENETKTAVEGDIGYQTLKFVMQIDNDIVVMIASYTQRIPKLYRFLFDASTGAFKGREKIAEMSVMTPTVAVSAVTIQAPERFIEHTPDFFIEKDPLSDYYAVGLLNSYASETNKMIEVVHYSPQHEKINSAYFISPDNKFKAVWMSDIYVNGSKSVILASYVYNDKANGGGNDAFFYLSQLNAGTTTFRNVALTQTIRYAGYDCNFVSDTIAKNVKVITKIYKPEIEECFFMCQIIHPETMEFGKQFEITTEMARQYYAKNINIVKRYYSQPQDYVIAQNGNGLVLSERIQSAGGGYYHQDIGITGIAPNGGELFGTVIRYFHYNMGRSTTYMDASKGSFTFTFVDEFHATYLDLVTGKNANYLLLNSTSEDSEQPENSKKAYKKILLANSAGLTTFIYTIGKNGEITRTYLFGKPVKDAEAKCCLLHTADYDPQTGLYVVSIVEKVNGKKMTSVVWMYLN